MIRVYSRAQPRRRPPSLKVLLSIDSKQFTDFGSHVPMSRGHGIIPRLLRIVAMVARMKEQSLVPGGGNRDIAREPLGVAPPWVGLDEAS
jgi:hypothetical protein